MRPTRRERCCSTSAPGDWDAELADLFRVPLALLPECATVPADLAERPKACSAARFAIRGVAGDQQAATIGQGCFTPGMMKSTYGTGCFALLNTGERPCVAQPPADHHRLSARRQAHLRAGRRDLHRRRRRAMAARRAETDRKSAPRSTRWRSGPIRRSRSISCRPLSAWARPIGTRRRAARFSGSRAIPVRADFARATLEAVGYQTRDLVEAMRADWPDVCRTVLRVDGGMTASDTAMQFLADILDARSTGRR